jgi:MoaA/NifB/PqqE/SkfB family radical SAM enzyme
MRTNPPPAPDFPAPGLAARLARHARMSRAARLGPAAGTPPLLVLFVNSICNLTCEHCFYWRNLNQRDDLSFDELAALSDDLGTVENLNLSGGEPFLRKDLDRIVRRFVRANGTRQVYVPTNGWYTERTVVALESILAEPDLQLFACELSLDGTEAYHDSFRGKAGSFRRALETYDALAALQRRDPRLRIHSISTVTDHNVDEIRALTDLLYERCPAMDHHNIAVIRGDRKNPDLRTPALADYRALVAHVERRWRDRESGRFGSIVEPLLQWTKIRTLEEQRQVVPCRAGWVAGVVYANGDVSLCELHPPIGNLRRATFREIWSSPEAEALRARITARECWCTTEVFLWPSIVYQPAELVRIGARSGAWKRKLARATPADGAG